mgnify:CR=1 FL=1
MAENSDVSELNENNFDEFVKDGLVLVDFWADWCMPCIMMAPVIDELSVKMKDVKFAKVDVSENGNLASKYQVSSIPNFILFENGQPKERFVGAMPLEEFEDKIKAQL